MRLESTRTAVADTLLELAETDPNILLICADSVLMIRGRPFAERFPDRYFDVGIAEQNAVGCAAGLAACGFIPFVATYAGFITMRACEQVRTFVAYPGLPVKLIGANGGMASGEREGVTHQFFEDLGIMRAISGITVVVPADASQVREAVRAVARCEGPAYVRIGSGRDPVVFEPPAPPFALGKARVLRSAGKEVALFGCGFVLNRVLEAAVELQKQGVGATVVEVHTLKPLDTESVLKAALETGAIVTAEEHSVIGGLGGAVAEIVSEGHPVPLRRVGLGDRFAESGPHADLLDRYGMSVRDIVSAAREVFEEKETRTR